MPIKELVIDFLKEKQNQLMEQYAILEEIQTENPEHYSVIQEEMDKVDWTCELIRRKIYELEVDDGKHDFLERF